MFLTIIHIELFRKTTPSTHMSLKLYRISICLIISRNYNAALTSLQLFAILNMRYYGVVIKAKDSIGKSAVISKNYYCNENQPN